MVYERQDAPQLEERAREAAGHPQVRLGARRQSPEQQGGARGPQEGPREVVLHPKVDSDLDRLPQKVQDTFHERVDFLRLGRRHTSTHPLNGPLKGWNGTSLSGQHRMVHRMSDGALEVLSVANHDEAYNNARRRASLEWPKSIPHEDLHHHIRDYPDEPELDGRTFHYVPNYSLAGLQVPQSPEDFDRNTDENMSLDEKRNLADRIVHEPHRVPPLVIADGQLIDGGHRAGLALHRGVTHMHAYVAESAIRRNAMGQAGPDYQGLHFKYFKNYSEVHEHPQWFDGHDKHDSRSFYGMMAFRPGEQQSVGTLEFSPLHYGEGDREVHVHGIKVNPEHQRRGVGSALLNHLESLYPDTPINHGLRTQEGADLTHHFYGRPSEKAERPGTSRAYGEAPYEGGWTLGRKPYDPETKKTSSTYTVRLEHGRRREVAQISPEGPVKPPYLHHPAEVSHVLVDVPSFDEHGNDRDPDEMDQEARNLAVWMHHDRPGHPTDMVTKADIIHMEAGIRETLDDIGKREHPNVDHYQSGGMGHIEGDDSKSVVGFMPTRMIRGYEGNETWNEDKINEIHDDIKSGKGITNPLMMIYDHKNKWAYLGEGNHRFKGAVKADARTVPIRFVRGDASYQKKRMVGGPMRLDSPWKGARGEDYIPTDIHPHHFMKESARKTAEIDHGNWILYHGTSRKNAESIAQHGFQHGHEESHGAASGKGFYFHEHPHKAREYGDHIVAVQADVPDFSIHHNPWADPDIDHENVSESAQKMGFHGHVDPDDKAVVLYHPHDIHYLTHGPAHHFTTFGSINVTAELNDPGSIEELVRHADGRQKLYQPTDGSGRPLCAFHANDEQKWSERMADFSKSVGLGEVKPNEHPIRMVGEGSCAQCHYQQQERRRYEPKPQEFETNRNRPGGAFNPSPNRWGDRGTTTPFTPLHPSLSSTERPVWYHGASAEHAQSIIGEAKAFTPHERVFTHTCGLDHSLFDSNGKLYPQIRADLLATFRDFCVRHDYRDFSKWSKLIFFGSEASEWTSETLEGNGDFDLSLGVEYNDFKETNPRYAGLTDSEIADMFTQQMHAELNNPDYHPPETL
jgi:GNAT superfamily N-acetyltransferase